MRHLFSVLLFVATLIGTSSFTYETTSTTRAENISLQTQKKYKGGKLVSVRKPVSQVAIRKNLPALLK